MVVARWIAMAALPLILLVILSQVAQQRRVEAATNELFELLAKHIVTHNGPCAHSSGEAIASARRRRKEAR
jgi:hypothetical protein